MSVKTCERCEVPFGKDGHCPECGREKPERCSCGSYYPQRIDRSCGAYVCDSCGDHKGLSLCYCGWSKHGTDGYRELIEIGETIDEDY